MINFMIYLRIYISQSSEILGIPNIAVLALFGIFLLKMPIFISF